MKVKLVAVTQPLGNSPGTAEELLAYCARVSSPENQANAETAQKLLAYMVRKKHWSPFEMVSMTVEIRTTRAIARQILRHRSFSFQEFSQRYSEVVAPPIKSAVRLQDTKNRQSSLETGNSSLHEWWSDAQDHVADVALGAYHHAIGRGIAKEVARNVLPEGMTESVMYMAGTVRSFIHYCDLRCGNGTQKEHREIAEEVRRVMFEIFPTLKGLC